jgi:anti-anti-sigma regulatory factor
MIVSVFTPPSRIDATNVAAFAKAVREHVTRHDCMVIDCSDVEWIAASGMHVLQMASYDTTITLVNPNPTVHLMSATFAGRVQCRYERTTSTAAVSEGPTRRLVSVPTAGRVAS